jgi:hypothetical protein
MRAPKEVKRLFWDVDAARIDRDRDADYVLERVMARGGWAAMRWLRATYSEAELADFLRRRGARLAPRERAYWSLIAGANLAQVPGGGRPPWL